MPMVPVAPAGTGRLADVLASCLASVRGESNPLGLPPLSHAVAVLVDGLGVANLRSASGHARHLSSRLTKRSVVHGVFPATTAVGLGSFCTGADAGSHGLVGYRVLDAEHDRLVNQLSGWDEQMQPETWQPLPTVFERARNAGVPAFAVGPNRYADSGLTHALLRGAEYRGADSVSARFDTARALLDETPRALIYLYVPELDMAAHARGWQGAKWTSELEALDAEIARFDAGLPPSTGVVLTADHGVIDVPEAKQVLFDTVPELVDGVRHVGGDPRCLYLYLEPGASADRLAEAWRGVEGHRSWVMTRAEAVREGLFGTVAPDVLPRIGDVIIAARAGIAYYDSREKNQSSRSMIGQHGSLTDEETRVPCIRLGGYAGY
ncbi:alkaline phosphatase family protein [Rathayibacter sp. YIM 133350]|uniref:alkaline phosphatase family protein n=1 Tax=Rathayibacter sp. YIM 133350 TaxID=3131992 RepID=UPI00307EAEB1